MTRLPRFMVAAAHKSSGKTVVSTGLAAALAGAGDDVGVFKKGPDYIDPMWLSAAAGRPCYNLDFNVMPRDSIPGFLAGRGQGASLALIEANKGLYDGVSLDGSDSNAAMAKLLGLPVVLVIDTLGMTRGIAPLLIGYRAFDADVNIAGVILNRVGGARHESKLRQAVEAHTDLPVLGAVGRDSRMEIGERHLGLTTPSEIRERDSVIAGFAEVIGASVDLEAVRAVAGSAPDLPTVAPPRPAPARQDRIRVGILRDAAFGFYYPDDLEAFEDAGATLVPIDALADPELPQIDGLFIGGGFPEMRMDALAANASLRRALKQALTHGLPCYAECGGLMYLCESLTMGSRTADMVGLVPGRAVMHRRPQGRGHVVFDCSGDHPWGAGGQDVRAHEFHYASIEGLPDTIRTVRRMTRGAGIGGGRDGIAIANTIAGFCHLRNTGAVPWVSRFVDFVARCRAGGCSAA